MTVLQSSVCVDLMPSERPYPLYLGESSAFFHSPSAQNGEI